MCDLPSDIVFIDVAFRLVPFPGIAEAKQLGGIWNPVIIRCYNLWVYPQLRKPSCEEERLILMGLTEDDETGWGAYADWLDENANGGKIYYKKLRLAERIRREIKRANRVR